MSVHVSSKAYINGVKKRSATESIENVLNIPGWYVTNDSRPTAKQPTWLVVT